MKQVWLEICSTVKYMLKKAFQVLPTALVITNPFITLAVAHASFQAYGVIQKKILIVPLILLLVTYFCSVIKRVVLLEVYGIPVARKRFTKRDERGNVVFSMSDMVEIVEYVNTVEEYCEQHGVYHRTKSVSLIALFVIGLALYSPFIVQAEECIECESVTCTLTAEEEVLIQKIALAEAENQGIAGMAFVMQVILNRIQSEDFPDTLVGVISQKKQFSAYDSGVYLKKEPNEDSKKALELAPMLLNRGILYFENPHGKESTWHSRNLEYVFKYKEHVFYK